MLNQYKATRQINDILKSLKNYDIINIIKSLKIYTFKRVFMKVALLNKTKFNIW